MNLRDQLRLYLVTDPALCRARGVAETVGQAVAAGVTMVQLRDKEASTADRIDLALALKDALRGTGVPLVINDDVEAAYAADVDGAHIGLQIEKPRHHSTQTARYCQTGYWTTQ